MELNDSYIRSFLHENFFALQRAERHKSSSDFPDLTSCQLFLVGIKQNRARANENMAVTNKLMTSCEKFETLNNNKRNSICLQPFSMRMFAQHEGKQNNFVSSGTYKLSFVLFLHYYFVSNVRIDLDEVFNVMSVYVSMYAYQFLV
jgi:hypothetical protein